MSSLCIDKVDPDVLKKSMIYSYLNAQEFYNEAKYLQTIESYGHSLSLSILGLEELGKSLGYYKIILFIKIPLQGRILFDPNAIFKDIQSWHRTKLSIIDLYQSLYNLSNENLMKLHRELDQHGKNIIYNTKKRQFQVDKNITNSVNNFIRTIKNIRALDKKKQRGLYVEIKPSGKEIFNPKDISKEENEEILNMLERGLTEFSFLQS